MSASKRALTVGLPPDVHAGDHTRDEKQISDSVGFHFDQPVTFILWLRLVCQSDGRLAHDLDNDEHNDCADQAAPLPPKQDIDRRPPGLRLARSKCFFLIRQVHNVS